MNTASAAGLKYVWVQLCLPVHSWQTCECMATLIDTSLLFHEQTSMHMSMTAGVAALVLLLFWHPKPCSKVCHEPRLNTNESG